MFYLFTCTTHQFKQLDIMYNKVVLNFYEITEKVKSLVFTKWIRTLQICRNMFTVKLILSQLILSSSFGMRRIARGWFLSPPWGPCWRVGRVASGEARVPSSSPTRSPTSSSREARRHYRTLAVKGEQRTG